MGLIAETILSATRISRFNAEKLLVGIDGATAGTKPRGAGGKVVDTNHPTFVYGHLSLYPARLFGFMGVDVKNVATPATWEPLFKAGAPCQDDPSGTIYPKFGEVSAFLLRATDEAMSVIAKTDDAAFQKPNPNEAGRERFPTIGTLANFYLTGHMMLHLGQVSAWRRCMGLPSAM